MTAKTAEILAGLHVAEFEGAARAHQAEHEKSGKDGIDEIALSFFAMALHTVTDKPSPEHGFDRPWFGSWLDHPSIWTLGTAFRGLWHVFAEAGVSFVPGKLDPSVEEAQGLYARVFGKDALEIASRRKPIRKEPREKVTVTFEWLVAIP